MCSNSACGDTDLLGEESRWGESEGGKQRGEKEQRLGENRRSDFTLRRANGALNPRDLEGTLSRKKATGVAARFRKAVAEARRGAAFELHSLALLLQRVPEASEVFNPLSFAISVALVQRMLSPPLAAALRAAFSAAEREALADEANCIGEGGFSKGQQVQEFAFSASFAKDSSRAVLASPLGCSLAQLTNRSPSASELRRFGSHCAVFLPQTLFLAGHEESDAGVPTVGDLLFDAEKSGASTSAAAEAGKVRVRLVVGRELWKVLEPLLLRQKRLRCCRSQSQQTDSAECTSTSQPIGGSAEEPSDIVKFPLLVVKPAFVQAIGEDEVLVSHSGLLVIRS